MFEYILIILLFLGAFLIGKYLYDQFVLTTTIFEYETGIHFHKGKFVGLLETGRHLFRKNNHQIIKIDTRPRTLQVPMQEILSKDNINLKISLLADIQIADPHKAIIATNDYESTIYSKLQLALRSVISTFNLDQIIEEREQIGKLINEKVDSELDTFGISLNSVNVKDVSLPGQLKQAFSQVVLARHEAMVSLERACGETATLRNLTNAAKIIEKNPTLMNLRVLHSAAEKSTNSFVINLAPEKPE